MDNSEVKQLSIDTLNGSHRELLERGISRVLTTNIAEITYAQIIDGLPLAEVANDTGQSKPQGRHPINEAHKHLCPGVLDKTQEFRDKFSPTILHYDSRVSSQGYSNSLRQLTNEPKLLFTYLAAAPASRAFNTRLIELLAVSIHQIAVHLFNLDISLHKTGGIAEWAPPKSDEFWWRLNPDGPAPTMFYHTWYQDSDQYPNGVADIVGYWAEARIFGGVVLFDRQKPKNQYAESDAIYLHPDRYNSTYRICRLIPEQKQALIEFIYNPGPCYNPLPILPNQDNRERIDPEEPIEETGVYRDIWERKNRPFQGWDLRMRDVWDKVDFPTLEDKGDAMRRAKARKFQADYGNDCDDGDGEEYL